MTIAQNKRQMKLGHWCHVIQACRTSGMSVSTWCQNNGIKIYSYYYWLRIIREESLHEHPTESSIVKVPDSILSQPETSVMEHPSKGLIRLDYHHVTVEFPIDYDIREIARLLKELER